MRSNKQNDNKKNVFEKFFLQIYCPEINVQRNVFLKYTVKPLPYDTPNTRKPFHYFTKAKCSISGLQGSCRSFICNFTKNNVPPVPAFIHWKSMGQLLHNGNIVRQSVKSKINYTFFISRKSPIKSFIKSKSQQRTYLKASNL